MSTLRSIAHPWLRTLLLAILGLHLLGSAHGAATDVAQVPLHTVSATPVKPNLLFVMDDSGSMSWNFLPEAAYFLNGQYGIRASQCNGLAFNPTQSYSPPVNASGGSMGNASITPVLQATTGLYDLRFTTYNNRALGSSGVINLTLYAGSLPYDYYQVGEGVTIYDRDNTGRWMIGVVTAYDYYSGQMQIALRASSGSGSIGTSIIGVGWPPFIYFNYSGSDRALGYTYAENGDVATSSAFYLACASQVGSTPGANVFSMQRVTSSSSIELQQSLANWWAYYGTRMKMMKTVTSQAFKDIDQRFRVGYSTILNTTARESSGVRDFLHVRDFGSSQKSSFYASFNAAVPGGSTPLRGALAKAGQYFAKKAPSQDTDPVQYACQRNYTILATDGAWNSDNETGSYGPLMLDGVTTVGQQDGTAPRPFKDASGGGSSNSLADVAMYYYATDLRTSALGNCTGTAGVDVCANSVKPLGKDTATWQHMTTFTMSLGQNGTLQYQPGYEAQATGDYAGIVSGGKQWPNPTTDATKVDDLWHAAVNGRGLFFNAADPVAVAEGLKSALSAIDQGTSRGAAVGTSTLRPVTGNNQAFIGRYTSGLWTGDLRAYRVNTSTGEVSTVNSEGNDIADWSAADKLRGKSNRKIFYAKPGVGLREFTTTNLSADGYLGDFSNVCDKLSQCVDFSASEKTAANSATNLVSYLRGTAVSVFRGRPEVLGDIVNSSPTFVRTPPFSHQDAGYDSFVSAQASRAGVVYVGANDGMLHAFDASTGDELWAFIPTAVRSQLYKLADVNFASNHQYFVDGTPHISDVYTNGAWRTVLIAGLGAGGKAYYALDITNPNTPRYLWEFTDPNLGLAMAPPLVAKRSNGKWVAAISSGYNNTGDGKGHLFLVDIETGTKVVDIATSAGDAATPSGLGPLAAWVESDTDATATRFYAGDTLGNLWRFDTEGLLEPKNAALLLAQFKVGGKLQPITTAPQLAMLNVNGNKVAAAFVGTGRMLGTSDLPNTDQQSIYGIKDPLINSSHGDIRAGTSLVKQDLVTAGTVRTASNNPVDWASKAGWYVDLPDAGERINVDMSMVYTTLVAASNVPPKSVAPCADDDYGYAWLYHLDIASGSTAGQNPTVKSTGGIVVGVTPVYTTNGARVITNFSRKDPPTPSQLNPPPRFLPAAKKKYWRELKSR